MVDLLLIVINSIIILLGISFMLFILLKLVLIISEDMKKLWRKQ